MVTSAFRVAGTLLAACLACATSGCFVEAGTDPGPPPPVVVVPAESQLTVRWTVDEATDPNLCIMGNAAILDLVVTTRDGTLVGAFQAPCDTFATTVSTLPPGDYQATARLVDSAGTQRTTSLSMAPFSLIAGTNLVIDVDFPADSFL